MTVTLSRRSFLIKSGWIFAGLTSVTACSPLIPPLPTTSEPEAYNNMWVQMLPNGRARFFCPRMEMGQGASVGLSQIVATELNLDQSSIECITPTTDDIPPFKLTVGSESIELFSKPVAITAANLRETLKERAAQYLNVSENSLKSVPYGFKSSDQSVTYAKLIKDEDDILFISHERDLDTLPLYSFDGDNPVSAVGKSWTDPHLLGIVTGKMFYSRDAAIETMLYAETLPRPSAQAQLKKVNWGNAASLPGIMKTVSLPEENLVAIIADTPFSLPSAVEEVSVEWETKNTEKPDFVQLLKTQSAENDFEHVLLEQGEKSKNSDRSFNATFSTPFATHAMMEPRAAVANVRTDKIDVWCGTQDPYWMKKRIAELLSRSEDEVTIHPMRMGGSFGGRVYCRAAEEAALLSNIMGKPVRVQWSRKQEFQSNYFQPAFAHQISADVSETGKITTWKHDFVSSPIITGPVQPPLSDLIDLFAADKGTARGAISPYDFDHQIIRYSDIRTDIPVGAWRGLGAAPNCFAIESMMDLLAEKAGIDPLEFRLDHLLINDQRMRAVLQEVGNLSNWSEDVPNGMGRGIALSYYKNKTRAAVVAEVRASTDGKAFKIENIYCVQDCGLVINPDQVKHQICGNIIWGCSMALKEELHFEEGRLMDENFDTYMPLTMEEAPNIKVKLLAQDIAPPLPVGESALPPVAPAIANAVFRATGQRITDLPLKLA
ncbi:molybdopterin-dependent oxidoreductase [Sneathiella sp. P13V-1]|uniref:xanthine dehydrogenase family protein molybdopterin-binding subunit n=1 Tax=Sneathiella sp. P13V-1 TaxID=2697366 RepID=UPI00187B6E75|nr:molybdopterin cofactor-binding domain-containing protein [Sneathiella sp. P13V-1]MBE7638211.1 molybdopterin-dependent oxidoreductase [Sneathiella sp. P13V-1]